MQQPLKGAQGGIWIPNSPSQGQMLYPTGGGRQERRDREPRRRHSSPPRSRERERDRDRDRDHRDRDAYRKEEKKSRWKENLTAASIGGAAVSLLNVLSEAAEGL
jgi:hypothetical protein